MPDRNTWKEFWSLSRKDRIGLGLIALLMLGILLAPNRSLPSLPESIEHDRAWLAAWERLLDSNRSEGQGKGQALLGRPAEQAPKKMVLFEFDPNTLDFEGWRKLGLREKTVNTILNYRSKGGRFHKAEDLDRIYGLFPDERERLKPWVRINNPPRFFEEKKASDSVSWASRGKTREVLRVNINLADSSAWEALPGIGPKLSARIIRFREALGGFVGIGQVAETFGLADSVFQRIRESLVFSGESPSRLNINLAPVEDLSRHPYIRISLARRMVAYRNQHGPFQHAEDLLLIGAIDSTLVEKLRPYLNFQ